GLIRTACAVAAMLAKGGDDLRQLLRRRQRAKVGDRIWQRRADEFLHRAKAALLHQIAETGVKFVHVAEAMLHHGGAELDGLCPERQEIRGVPVGHRTAVARDGDARAGNPGEGEIADRQNAFAGHANNHAFLPAAVFRFAEREGRKAVGERDTGFFARVTREDFLNRLNDRLDGGDCGGELEQLRVVVVARFHDPINDLRRQSGVLRNNVAVRAVAALRTGEAVFDTHRAGVLQLARVGLPDRLVRLVVAGDRAAGRGERQAIREFLDEFFDFAADAVERMAGNVVAIAVGRAREREHVAGGNVDRHVVERGLHHAAGPAALVGLAHLFITIRVRRGGEQERRENPAAKKIGIEWHRAQRHAGQDDSALRAVLELRSRFATNERGGFSGGVLAAGDGLHHRCRPEHHVASVENSTGFRDRQFGTAADGGNYEIELTKDRRFPFADDEILRSRLFARWQHHPGNTEASNAFASADDRQRLGTTGDLNAVFEQHVALILCQRHVLFPTAINQFDGGSAETFGRCRAIRRHRAAAEDGDLFAFEFELLLVFQKHLPRQREFLAGKVQL